MQFVPTKLTPQEIYVLIPEDLCLKLEAVVKVVSKVTRVSVGKIKGTSRFTPIMIARHLTMFLCREFTTGTLESVGAYVGYRNHGTVINSCQVIEELVKTKNKRSNEARRYLLACRKSLQANPLFEKEPEESTSPLELAEASVTG